MGRNYSPLMPDLNQFCFQCICPRCHGCCSLQRWSGELVPRETGSSLFLPPASWSCTPPTACPHRGLTVGSCTQFAPKHPHHMQPCIAPHRQGTGTACVPTTCPCKPSKSLTSQPSPLCSSREGSVCRAGEDQRPAVSHFTSSEWSLAGEEVIRLASVSCSYAQESNGVVLLPLKKLYLLGVTHCIWVTDYTWEKLPVLSAGS